MTLRRMVRFRVLDSQALLVGKRAISKLGCQPRTKDRHLQSSLQLVAPPDFLKLRGPETRLNSAASETRFVAFSGFTVSILLSTCVIVSPMP
eukprot:4938658-Amphidinium_carterae.1